MADPLLLFTPPASAASDTSPTPRPQTKNQPAQIFVVPPSLSSEDKRQYKSVPAALNDSGVEFEESDVDEIIGEHYSGERFFFVRFRDGFAYRLPSKAFKARFPQLVTKYERKKKQGHFKSFDPSGASVHPESRFRNTVHLNMSGAKSGKVMNKDDDYASESQGSTGSESSLTDLSEKSQSEEDPPLRRSKRSAVSSKKTKPLPFSPRKTRSKTTKALVSADSGDESEGVNSDLESLPPRRSTRKKNIKPNLIDSSACSDTEADEDEGESDSYSIVQRPKIVKKKLTPKILPPAYGFFRPVENLDYDEDPKTAVLRAHRNVCDKCHQKPTHVLLANFKGSGKGRRRKRTSSDSDDDEESKLTKKGGWVRCLKCPVVAHWDCLSREQSDKILRAALAKDRERWQQTQSQGNADDNSQAPIVVPEPKKRAGLGPSETTDFVCMACMRGGICMGCQNVVSEPDIAFLEKSKQLPTNDVEMTPISAIPGLERRDAEINDGIQTATTSKIPNAAIEGPSKELLFRCMTCKRAAHYAHLPTPLALRSFIKPGDAIAPAMHHQFETEWDCSDCHSFVYKPECILAWRPYPADATELPLKEDEELNIRIPLPREYLVKWIDRSFRRTQWVPHMWLVARHFSLLKNFLSKGPKLDMLVEPLPIAKAARDIDTPETSTPPIFEIGVEDSRETSARPEPKFPSLGLEPSLDAERRIMPAWKTVHYVLDVLFWTPEKHSKKDKRKRHKTAVDDNDVLDSINADPEVQAEYAAAFDEGEQPSEDLTETVAEYQKRIGRKVMTTDIDRVIWAFIKWADLPYDECSWDCPPRPGEFGYSAYKAGFERFVASRSVVVPIRKGNSMALDANRPQDGYARYVLEDGQQPELGQSSHLKLMPFQIDGFNWLCNNWWNLQHCILADEMGLGKTVQIAAFLGNIIKRWEAWPALIVVPNSTVTNWVRELLKWAPTLRVVAYHGQAKGRAIVKKYELYHDVPEKGTTGSKFHILVTTYETLTNAKDSSSVFQNVPRWEVLIVDEGQRLKSDRSLLFKKLKQLNCLHRIIMTGTPLNNNIRELFNLMNFLDPNEWDDLEALEKEHTELTEELVKQLHSRLRPYFLRRIKAEVLQLPPKNEVIVPLSMTPLQKNVYRSILSQNYELLKTLTEATRAKYNNIASKANMNNILMQLRKCLQHPYIYSAAIEPADLSPNDIHEKLIDGSAKLRLLKSLLPKLKARGHRVLLFSQFVVALNVIEDFVAGEGYKFLRLDGDTPQPERQKGMDEFNRPGSEVFIYLLSTRAGGVGINLWGADTVIIHDPDFNPHQDLQAIARAHRYGQTKTCLVFKLMVKGSAEERIVQNGKKKLILDHLIVQKMDEDDSGGNDLQSILTYGAKELFEDSQEGKDIVYADQDLDNLIEKTENEETKEAAPTDGNFSFSFAKIWASGKNTMEEVADDLPLEHGIDSWANTLQRIEAAKQMERKEEATGRGVRRKAAAVFSQSQFDFEDSPVKTKKSRSSKSTSGDDDAFAISPAASDTDSDALPLTVPPDGSIYTPTDHNAQPTEKPSKVTTKKVTHREPKISNRVEETPFTTSRISFREKSPDDDVELCGLCGTRHGLSSCAMTLVPENLVEYRRMLLTNANYESFEERKAALNAIDESLNKLGKLHLVAFQPPTIFDARKVEATSIASKVSPPQMSAVPNLGRGTSNTSQNPLRVPNLMVGPSKRAQSPVTRDPNEVKKIKKLCKLGCGQSKHALEHCPVVRGGPLAISRAINRHDSNPTMSTIVRKLRVMLSQQQKSELGRNASTPMVIE